jgi:hypothetical protein
VWRAISPCIPPRVALDCGVKTPCLRGENTVEASAAPPQLQTESAVTGATFEATNVRDLPLGGDIVSLALLSAGVMAREPGSSNGLSANDVVPNGQNNFLLNGVDNNSNLIDYSSGNPYVVSPPLEAIGEVRIMTNGFNAE